MKLADKARGLSGTLAVFQQTRNNVATPDLTNPLFSIQTGQQRSRGFEADPDLGAHAGLVDTRELRLYRCGGHARQRHPCRRQAGSRAQAQPAASHSATGSWRGRRGPRRSSAGITAVSSRQLTLPNTVSVPGMATVDAQASYDFGRYTIQVSGYNLTGRRTFEPYQCFGFPRP